MSEPLFVIVDRDSTARAARAAILTAAGWSVLDATDGMAALATVRSHPGRPLLLLLREAVPGVEALRTDLAETAPFVIALTDGGQPDPLPGADVCIRDDFREPEWLSTISAFAVLWQRQFRQGPGVPSLPAETDSATRGYGLSPEEPGTASADRIPVMIGLLGPDGARACVNRCWSETLGWTLDDAESPTFGPGKVPDATGRSRLFDWFRNPGENPVAIEVLAPDGRTLSTVWTGVVRADGTRVGVGLDLTRCREAEAEKLRLVEIIDAASDLILTTDCAGRVTRINRTGRELLGVPADAEVRDINIRDHQPDWVGRLVAEEALPAAARAGRWQGDSALLLPPGQECPVSQIIISHRDQRGEIEYFSSIMRDISELKRAEQALRFDRALFGALETMAPVGLGFVDWNTRILRLNRTMTEMSGIPAAAAIGRPLAEVVPGLWPTLEPVYRRVLQQGEVVANLELAAETPGRPGVRRHWLTSHYPLRVGNEVVAVGIVAQEISELKQAEEARRDSERRLEQALMGAEMGLWDWNAVTGKIVISDRWARIVGTEEATELNFDRWLARVHPEDQEGIATALARHVVGETAAYEAEYRFLNKAGDYVWVVSRGKILGRDDAGDALRVVGTYRDIGNRKQLEQRLAEQQEQLLHVQRLASAGELVAIVGHELNQPLSALSMYLGGVLLRFADALDTHPALRNALQESLRQAIRAADVVKSLRGLIRRHDLENEWVAFPELVQDCLLLTDSELRRRRIRLELDIPEDLPAYWGQRVYLQQLLLNLMLNAIEAMADSSAEPRFLRIGANLTDCGAIEIRVADSGPGLAPGIAERLFDPFVSSKPDGIGLGLSICRTIVEAHAGRIEAESAPGAGACFRITLPLIG